jgi:hypothetical protein
MTRTGVIKRGSLTHLLTREIEKGKKMILDAKYEQNVPTDYKNITERLAWYNIDEGSAQILRALPNQDGIMKNNIFMVEGVRTFLGIKVKFWNHLQMANISLEEMVKR